MIPHCDEHMGTIILQDALERNFDGAFFLGITDGISYHIFNGPPQELPVTPDEESVCGIDAHGLVSKMRVTNNMMMNNEITWIQQQATLVSDCEEVVSA